VSADVGWFFSFPGRESKANDQNSKNVPSRATRPTFATESGVMRTSASDCWTIAIYEYTAQFGVPKSISFLS
jgi:hypothetical protein